MATVAGSFHPAARRCLKGVDVVRDVPYCPTGQPEHLLDVYRPANAGGPLPVVLYVHGGSFRILSKNTHRVMGAIFAQHGYLTFNINYHLAPRHPYPAALRDTCEAYRFVLRRAQEYGGDVGRIVCAGESAGANLVTALALASCISRPETWAREVFLTDVRPAAVVAACGLLEVSDPGRYQRRGDLPVWVVDRLFEACTAYLDPERSGSAETELADPLLLLEGDQPLERPLPPFFVPVGTRDPLLDDSVRLEAALKRRSTPCVAPRYAGQGHAFHTLLWRSAAQQCWRDTFAFLDHHLPSS
jgi:acetyl esterase